MMWYSALMVAVPFAVLTHMLCHWQAVTVQQQQQQQCVAACNGLQLAFIRQQQLVQAGCPAAATGMHVFLPAAASGAASQGLYKVDPA